MKSEPTSVDRIYTTSFTRPIFKVLDNEPQGELARRLHSGERVDCRGVPFDKQRHIAFGRVEKWIRFWDLAGCHLSDFSFLYLKCFAPEGSEPSLLCSDVQRGIIHFFNLLTYDPSIQLRDKKVGDFMANIRTNKKLNKAMRRLDPAAAVTAILAAAWLERFPNPIIKDHLAGFASAVMRADQPSLAPNAAVLPEGEMDDDNE